MNSLRILQVIPSIAQVHGGPSEAIRLIERALSEEGIRVETATSDDDGPGRRNGKPTLGAPIGENGVVRRYFAQRLDFYKVCPSFVPWIFHHVRDYDVIHIHALFSFLSVVAALVASIRGVPYIVRPLGTLGQYGITRRRSFLKRLSLFIIEGRILRNAAAIHFTSDQEFHEAQVLQIPLRGHVIPLGLFPPAVADKSAAVRQFPELEESRNILYLSRLDPKKNVEALLRGFASIRESLPDVRLLLAGDGRESYVRTLQLLANDLGLGNSVVWIGHVQGELKASLFACAHLFVLPSFSENFGISVVEAVMAGLPCIVSDGVAVATTISRGGAGLVTGTDAESIARAVYRLCSDEALRTTMANNAKTLALKEFSAKSMGSSLITLYLEVALTQRVQTRLTSNQ